jgi:hypothetical protein
MSHGPRVLSTVGVSGARRSQQGREAKLGVWTWPPSDQKPRAFNTKIESLACATGKETDRDRGDSLDPNAGRFGSRRSMIERAVANSPAFGRSVAVLPEAGVRVLFGPGRLEPQPPRNGGDALERYPLGARAQVRGRLTDRWSPPSLAGRELFAAILR